MPSKIYKVDSLIAQHTRADLSGADAPLEKLFDALLDEAHLHKPKIGKTSTKTFSPVIAGNEVYAIDLFHEFVNKLGATELIEFRKLLRACGVNYDNWSRSVRPDASLARSMAEACFCASAQAQHKSLKRLMAEFLDFCVNTRRAKLTSVDQYKSLVSALLDAHSYPSFIGDHPEFLSWLVDKAASNESQLLLFRAGTTGLRRFEGDTEIYTFESGQKIGIAIRVQIRGFNAHALVLDIGEDGKWQLLNSLPALSLSASTQLIFSKATEGEEFVLSKNLRLSGPIGSYRLIAILSPDGFPEAVTTLVEPTTAAAAGMLGSEDLDHLCEIVRSLPDLCIVSTTYRVR